MMSWSYTIWLFNIAMENGPFIDVFPIKTSIYKGVSIAMLNNQRVSQSNKSMVNLPRTSTPWLIIVSHPSPDTDTEAVFVQRYTV